MHYNRARTGVRLIGPTPKWARTDGGEAGLHPSNIHDNAYAVGAIDFTGDMPIILGPDGPILGGFVCPATIARDEQWKMGQLRPGDTMRFRPVGGAGGRAATRSRRAPRLGQRIARRGPASSARQDVRHRRHVPPQGDDNLLVEYGPMTLDLALRMRVHALLSRCRTASTTTAARHHRPHPGHPLAAAPRTTRTGCRCEGARPGPRDRGHAARDDGPVVPSRTVHLPLSWDDPATARP